MKRKLLITIVGILLLIVVAVCVFHYCSSASYAYPYNDQFVIGNSRDKIIERYGKFDDIHYNAEGDMVCGIYMVQEDTPELIMSYDDSLWYEIYFEGETAVRVNLREGRIGG